MSQFCLQGNVAYGCRAAPGICAALASRGHGAAAAAVKRFVWNEHCEEEKKRSRLVTWEGSQVSLEWFENGFTTMNWMVMVRVLV